jgi:hypothetical protein
LSSLTTSKYLYFLLNGTERQRGREKQRNRETEKQRNRETEKQKNLFDGKIYPNID